MSWSKFLMLLAIGRTGESSCWTATNTTTTFVLVVTIDDFLSQIIHHRCRMLIVNVYGVVDVFVIIVRKMLSNHVDELRIEARCVEICSWISEYDDVVNNQDEASSCLNKRLLEESVVFWKHVWLRRR